jgi:hypothetical protein
MIGSTMSETGACQHQRTQLIAKDSDAEYVECLDCGAILEAHELGALATDAPPNTAAIRTEPDSGEPAKGNSIDESLSDA